MRGIFENLGFVVEQLTLDLISEWIYVNKGNFLAGNVEEDKRQTKLSVNGLTTYQPFDGIMDLKIVRLIFFFIIFIFIFIQLKGMPILLCWG